MRFRLIPTLMAAVAFVVLVGLGTFCFRGYDLDRARHAEIRRELDARSNGEA